MRELIRLSVMRDARFILEFLNHRQNAGKLKTSEAENRLA